MTPNHPGRPAIGEPVQIRLPAAMLADIDMLAGAVHRYSLTARLIVLLDTMENMPASVESAMVRVRMINELEGRMTDDQRARYDDMFSDENAAVTMDLSDAALMLVAFEGVAA